MARYVELRRHTDNDGDALTEDGVRAALEIGQQLAGGYALLVSTGAQRATQTLACFACVLREPVAGRAARRRSRAGGCGLRPLGRGAAARVRAALRGRQGARRRPQSYKRGGGA